MSEKVLKKIMTQYIQIDSFKDTMLKVLVHRVGYEIPFCEDFSIFKFKVNIF